MVRSFVDKFDCDIEEVFNTLIHCENINVFELFHKRIKKYEAVYDDDKYLGFNIEFDIGDGTIASIFNEIVFYKYCKEIRYVTKNFTTKDGKDISQLLWLPYKGMAQRVVFNSVRNKTEIYHQIYLNTNGLLSWLQCYFYIFPAMKKEELIVNKKLKIHFAKKNIA